MRKVIIIGTLHLGLTPKDDLATILEELKPTQLLLELPEDKGSRIKTELHADEMGFANNWADLNGIKVSYFDTDTSVLKDPNIEDDPAFQKLVQEQVEELKSYSWQELNKKELWQSGRTAAIEEELRSKYFDTEKWESREWAMLKNIHRHMDHEGVIVILTGAGHLDFFEKELPEADMIFRK